jgi:hypothetical protein
MQNIIKWRNRKQASQRMQGIKWLALPGRNS